MAVTQYTADTIPAEAKAAVDAAAVKGTKRLCAVAGFNAGYDIGYQAGIAAAVAAGDKLAAEERQLRIDWYRAAAESRMDDKAYRTAYLDHLSELREAVQVLAGAKEGTEARP